jgi:PAS domain S-box-containing protein
VNGNPNESHPAPESVPEESAEELYETAPCGYLSTTPEGRIIRVNRTFLEWMGYEHRQLTGGLRFLDLLTVGGKIFYETHFALLLRLHGHVDEIALDLECPDGRVIPTLVSARQKRNAAGEPVLNRLTVFNATERKRYERELLKARKRAEESVAELSRVNAELAQSNAALLKANEELAQFAYAANHDLQEPLRNIRIYVQLLARRYQGDLDEEAGTYLHYILDSSLRMQMLIDDLLSFSRAQSSDLVLRPTEMEFALGAALSNVRSSLDESGAIVTHAQLPWVMVDAARMIQVFQNLVGNAIKYRKPGETARVHISVTREEGSAEWLFAVEDNGLGFASQYSEQIFGMFKRLHGREMPGTGIGLAICKRIIESHGGRIWATSTPGVGSRFCFTIPDRRASEVAACSG